MGFITMLLSLLRVAPERYTMCDNDDGEAVVRVKAGLLPQLIAMEEEGEEADEAAVEAVARAAAATLARDGARKAAAVEARAKKVAQEEARIAAAAVEGGSPRRRLAHGRQPPPPPPAEGDASPKQPSLPRPRSRRPSEEEEAAASPKPEELAAQGVAAAVTAAALEAELGLGTPPRGGTELAVAPAERAEEAGRHRRGLRRQLGVLKQAEVTARTPAAEAAEVVGAKMEPKAEAAAAAAAAEAAAAAAEAAAAAAAEAAAWPIDPRAVEQFCTMFAEACAAQGPGVDRLGKAQAGAVLTSSGLPTQLLLQIWSLADVDGDDQLDLRE
jgi:hypothetical protein